jgi:hypothetical protein
MKPSLASYWLSKFNPLHVLTLNRKRISDGLMMYETDNANNPITFRFYTDEGKAQYSLSRSEAAYLASLLEDFLEKGQQP